LLLHEHESLSRVSTSNGFVNYVVIITTIAVIGGVVVALIYNAYYKKPSESFSNTGINNTYHYTTPYYHWQTPSFIQIRKKKTKRTSPYLETELWEREELKYFKI
jgi:hypothetical protein